MLKSVSIRNSVLACLADCPADNHARRLALFLYGTLRVIKTERNQQFVVDQQLYFFYGMKKSYWLESSLSRKQPLFLLDLDVVACELADFRPMLITGRSFKNGKIETYLQRTKNKDASQQHIKTMLKPVLNRNSVLACNA